MQAKILVVDDERPIAEILKYNLEREGFQVSVAYDGAEAIRKAEAVRPDLMILDLMLPKVDGLEVCRQVRRKSQVPILMLTAKGEETDKVLGLELGADDYVTKPFSPRELIARVKAILRRTKSVPPVADTLDFGELVIDASRYEVWKRGQMISLTPREFELLRFMASRPQQVFSRDVLLAQVWGYEFSGDSRVVDVTIRRLREKIEDDASSPRYIQTKRGVGYFFSRP